MINKELKLKYIKSLKSGGKVPKYQTAWGKLDKQNKLDDWSNNWQFRTTPLSNSKIVGGWKPGSRNGHVESDEEYTARRRGEEEKAAKKRTGHIKKAADTAHMIGTLALPAGIAASAAVSLPATLGGIAGGIAGERAVDYGLGKLADMTGSKVRSWKDLTDKYLGWSPTLQTITNPGTLLGGGIGAKGAQLSKGAIDYLIAMDMARYGHTPTTRYYFKPGYLGANGTSVGKTPEEIPLELSPRQLSDGRWVIKDPDNPGKQILWNKYLEKHNGQLGEISKSSSSTPVDNYGFASLLKDIRTDKITTKQLEKHLAKNQATALKNLAKRFDLDADEMKYQEELLLKYFNKLKNKKGSNDNIKTAKNNTKSSDQLAEEEYNSILWGEDAAELGKLEKQVYDKYHSPIKWNWFDQGILAKDNISPRTALSKAIIDGKEDTQPIMQAFMKNMNSELVQNTFQKLVKDGILIPVGNKWVTRLGKISFEVVDPARFTLNHILKQQGSTNRIDYALRPGPNGDTKSQIPWHGSNIGGEDFIPTYNNPTKTRPVFTSIDDGAPGFDNVKNAYGTATKVPLMRKVKEFEHSEGPWIAKPGASHGSNSFDDYGELYKYFTTDGVGKARMVQEVSDVRDIPGNTGMSQNEYNFGQGTPDVKFLLNTFYFNGKKGAFNLKKGGKLNEDNNKFRNWNKFI